MQLQLALQELMVIPCPLGDDCSRKEFASQVYVLLLKGATFKGENLFP